MRWQHSGHGRLLVPRCHDRAADSVADGVVWGADNDCFNKFDPVKWQRMLYKLVGLPGCLFINAPDAFDKDAGIGDHEATLRLWEKWHPFLSMLGMPISFVLQNGCCPDTVPWDQCDAVFIGGCTEWKLGPEAAAIIDRAKELGKHVHMGRVNSVKRIKYAHSIGVDSVDGSGWAKFRDAMMPKGLRILDALNGTDEAEYAIADQRGKIVYYKEDLREITHTFISGRALINPCQGVLYAEDFDFDI